VGVWLWVLSNERERISAFPSSGESLDRALGLLQELVTFSVYKTDSDESSIDAQLFAANFQELPTFSPTVGCDEGADDHFRKLLGAIGALMSRPFVPAPSSATTRWVRSATKLGTAIPPSRNVIHNNPPRNADSVMS